MLDPGRQVRERQLKHLQAYADPGVFDLTHKLLAQMNGLDVQYRLPLIDIAIPALKQLSLAQYQVFRDNLVALIEMDSRIDLLEWSLQKILFNHLDGQYFKLARAKVGNFNARQLKREIELILSVMAYASDQDQNEIAAAFSAATQSLEFSELLLVAKNKISLSDLDTALLKLAKLQPLVKPELLKACAVSVVHDDKISALEVELLRAFSDVLDCPMPPVIP